MGPFPQDGNWPWVMWLFQKVWMVAVTKCEEQRQFFQLIMGNLFYYSTRKKIWVTLTLLHYTTLKNALVQYTTVKCSRYIKYQPNNKAKWANSSCFTMPDKVHNHVWTNQEHNKLHYTTIHYTLLYYTTLHFIKLHYTTLVYGKLLSFEAKLTHKSVPLSCVK